MSPSVEQNIEEIEGDVRRKSVLALLMANGILVHMLGIDRDCDIRKDHKLASLGCNAFRHPLDQIHYSI